MPEYEVEQEACSLANPTEAEGCDIKGPSCDHETLAPKGGADLETLPGYWAGASCWSENGSTDEAL